MKATAEKMEELGYDYFTTTLTVSPHKNSQVINEVGRDIEDQYGYAYLPTDFKKNNGFLTLTKMTEAYHLYRRPYSVPATRAWIWKKFAKMQKPFWPNRNRP